MKKKLEETCAYLDLLRLNDTPRIKTSTEIHKYIKDFSDCFSHTTAEKKLKTFKSIMIYVYRWFTNPYLASYNEPLTPITTELKYIHYKMYLFLSQNNFMSLTQHTFDNVKFHWNIPVAFMPIFISYVLATNSTKCKPLTANIFFETLEHILEVSQKQLFYQQKNDALANYSSWATIEIGKDYFCKLEELNTTFKNDNEIFSIINDATRLLTNIILHNDFNNPALNLYTTYLLDSYIDALKTMPEAYALSQPKNTFIFQKEKDYINFLLHGLYQTTEQILSYTQNYFKKNPGNKNFPISISNYSEWEKKYKETIDALSPFEEILKIHVDNFYTELQSSFLKTSDNLNSSDYTVHYVNIKSHSDYIIKTFSSSFKEILKEFNKFKRNVKRVSVGDTAAHKNPDLKLYTFADFNQEINRIRNALLDKLKKEIPELPPYIEFHQNNHLKKYVIPTVLETQLDALQIIWLLQQSQQLKLENTEKLINELQFPLNLVDFLNRL